MPDAYSISRDERGRWIFSANEFDPLSESGSFRTQSEALDALRNHLQSKGLAVSETRTSASGLIVETRPAYGPTRPDITIRTSVLPELGALIDKLSLDLGMGVVQTITQALVILEIIVEQGKQGKRIAITDADLEVEREILIPGRPHDEHE